MTTDERCPTTHGHYRCKHSRGHTGNCEAEDQSRFTVALGPYRDQLRTVAYVRGAIDFGSGGQLDTIGFALGVKRNGADDCAYRALLSRSLP